jgi:hypothetical protein
MNFVKLPNTPPEDRDTGSIYVRPSDVVAVRERLCSSGEKLCWVVLKGNEYGEPIYLPANAVIAMLEQAERNLAFQRNEAVAIWNKMQEATKTPL